MVENKEKDTKIVSMVRLDAALGALEEVKLKLLDAKVDFEAKPMVNEDEEQK